jgi:hypothetical protein
VPTAETTVVPTSEKPVDVAEAADEPAPRASERPTAALAAEAVDEPTAS